MRRGQVLTTMMAVTITAVLVVFLFPMFAKAGEETRQATAHPSGQVPADETPVTREPTPYEAGLLYGMLVRCLSVEAGNEVRAATCRLRHRRATETRAEYLRNMGCTSDEQFAFMVGLWESTSTALPDGDGNYRKVADAILSRPPASPPAEWMLYKYEWCVPGQQSSTPGDQVRRHKVQQDLAFTQAVLNGLRREASQAESVTPSGSGGSHGSGSGDRSGPDADTLVQIARSREAEMYRSISRTGGAAGIAQEAVAAWYEAVQALKREGRYQEADEGMIRAAKCMNLATGNFISGDERSSTTGV